VAVAGFLRGGLAAALNTVKGPAGGVLRIINDIAGAFWAAVHAVEAFIHILSQIHVPHLSLPSIHLPHIPGTATGGIVSSPQIRLVGEAGPEAIIPLSKYGGSFGGGGGMVADVHTHVYLDGKQISETVRRELLRTQGRNGGLGFT
jgi:hypothetical protein